MPLTPVYSLPYQSLGDAPNGPVLGQDLAEAVETELARIDADTQIVRFGPNSKALNTSSLSGTTTSATYVDMPSGASFSFTKRHASTSIAIDVHIGMLSTAVNTVARFGVRISGTDFDIGELVLNPVNTHERGSGTRDVQSGLAAGTYTIQGRWLRVSGSGTLTFTGDWFSMRATEVLPA